MRIFTNYAKGTVVVVIVSIVASCSRQQVPVSAPSNTTNILSVAYSISPAAAPLLVATEKDFWKDQLIKIDPKEFAVGRLCLDAVLGGNADIGTVAETPLVYAALHGAKFYILCSITYSTEHQRCLARKDRGIVNPADIVGKRVAAYLGTASEYHMDEFLKANNLRRDQFELINLKPPEMVNAMVSGQVDVVFAWEPFAYQIEQRLGSNVTRFSVSSLYTMTFDVVCRPEFVEQHPKLVQALLQVMLRTTEYMRSNRDESITLVAKKLGVSSDSLAKIWSGYDFDVRLDSTLLDLLQKEGAWVREKDPTTSAAQVALRTLLYDQPLRSLKPSAVSLP